MPKFTTHKIVHHSSEKMFNLVADIESYPLFLPMCESLKIYDRKEKGDKTLLIAKMTIGYKFINESFTTRVFLNPNEKRIEVSYIDGPFKYLENLWAFHDLDENKNSCDIEFFINYTFKNPMLSALMGSMFDSIFKKFTDAFEKRADEIYK